MTQNVTGQQEPPRPSVGAALALSQPQGWVPLRGWQDQALTVSRCAVDFKFRNCSVSYFEKNAWGIKYLQKISSCVNNRKIQYSVSGPVFNKFENFMILLLLFIAYFICRCLFSQAARIWCLTTSRGAEGRRALPRPCAATRPGRRADAPRGLLCSRPTGAFHPGKALRQWDTVSPGALGGPRAQGCPRGVKGCGR